MQTRVEAIEERIREAAEQAKHYHKGGAPRLTTIAKYIKANSDYVARVKVVTEKPFGCAERTFKRLDVYKIVDICGEKEAFLEYSHDSDDPHRTNHHVCQWVVENVMSGSES